MRIISFRTNWLTGIRLNPIIIRLSYFSYFIALSAHWVACFWLSIRNSFSAVGVTKNLTNEYLRSLYWSLTTITTIGYGDITPNLNKNTELVFTMFVQILGVGCVWIYNR